MRIVTVSTRRAIEREKLKNEESREKIIQDE